MPQQRVPAVHCGRGARALPQQAAVLADHGMFRVGASQVHCGDVHRTVGTRDIPHLTHETAGYRVGASDGGAHDDCKCAGLNGGRGLLRCSYPSFRNHGRFQLIRQFAYKLNVEILDVLRFRSVAAQRGQDEIRACGLRGAGLFDGCNIGQHGEPKLGPNPRQSAQRPEPLTALRAIQRNRVSASFHQITGRLKRRRDQDLPVGLQALSDSYDRHIDRSPDCGDVLRSVGPDSDRAAIHRSFRDSRQRPRRSQCGSFRRLAGHDQIAAP